MIISGHSGSTPALAEEDVVSVIDETSFTINVNVTVGGTGGTFVKGQTSEGAAGYQHVSDFSGFSGFIGKLRDSDDDITYADLLSFADVTAARNGQRVEVTGDVERYVAYSGDVTGTGSITALAGLARF